MNKKRRSIRLKHHSYTDDGAYFITICTHQKQYLFGNLIEDGVWLSHYGTIVLDEWERTAQLRNYVKLDAFVIMPNHIHGILFLQNDYDVGAWRAMPLPRKFSQPTSRSLPTIVGALKSAITKRINQYRNTPSQKVWQRNYYERVVSNEAELNRLRNYILTNPMRWQTDTLYLKN